jgi:hypothetical protein
MKWSGMPSYRPIWEIFRAGTDISVPWITHSANKRFAIFKGSTGSPSDDLVLDKETGLIWPRTAQLPGGAINWLDANTKAREFVLASRIGWRLPTVEELASLTDTTQANPALPSGHPFITVQFGANAPAYWTSTNSENPSAAAWFVNLGSGGAGLGAKNLAGFAWPVRAGRGGVNWNW